MLVSGLFALSRLWSEHRATRGRPRAVLLLVAGWMLGFMLAAPHLLPLFEYSLEGARMAVRQSGAEERPPVGLSALPQAVLPDLYGAMRNGSCRYVEGVQMESSAVVYAGLIATLFVAPLAWCSRRHRSFNRFCMLLLILGLGWSLDLPGLVSVLRLPGLNMMSHNRLVFAASFAILAQAAIGLDALDRGDFGRRRWFLVPGFLCAGSWHGARTDASSCLSRSQPCSRYGQPWGKLCTGSRPRRRSDTSRLGSPIPSFSQPPCACSLWQDGFFLPPVALGAAG